MKLPHAHVDPDGLEEFSVVFTDRSLEPHVGEVSGRDARCLGAVARGL